MVLFAACRSGSWAPSRLGFVFFPFPYGGSVGFVGRGKPLCEAPNVGWSLLCPPQRTLDFVLFCSDRVSHSRLCLSGSDCTVGRPLDRRTTAKVGRPFSPASGQVVE